MDQQDDDPLKKLRDQQKGMVTCRLCKGDHWTSKCPFKDSLGVSAMKEMDETGKGYHMYKLYITTVSIQLMLNRMLQLLHLWLQGEGLPQALGGNMCPLTNERVKEGGEGNPSVGLG